MAMVAPGAWVLAAEDAALNGFGVVRQRPSEVPRFRRVNKNGDG